MITPNLNFQDWKLLLREDCRCQGKLPAFDSLGEYVLSMLWEEGLDPTVQGILANERRADATDA